MAQALAALLPARKPSPQARISAGLIARILNSRAVPPAATADRAAATFVRQRLPKLADDNLQLDEFDAQLPRLVGEVASGGVTFRDLFRKSAPPAAFARSPCPQQNPRLRAGNNPWAPRTAFYAQHGTAVRNRPAAGLSHRHEKIRRSWDSNARERLVAFFALSLSPLSRSSRPSWVHTDESSGVRLTSSRALAIASASRPSAPSE
jgi:hypothetical protein